MIRNILMMATAMALVAVWLWLRPEPPAAEST